MAHESFKSLEQKGSFGTLVGAFSMAAIAAVTAEAGATFTDLRAGSRKANVVSNIRAGEYSTFIIPGYHADGSVMAKNLDRHLTPIGSTHFAVHPDRGFSLDSIREEWLKARRLDGHRPARIYAISMGGLLMAKLFSDERFRQEFGEVDKVVLDSALSGKKDVRPSQKLAMEFGAILPVTYSTGRFYRFASSGHKDEDIDHSPEVLWAEARERLGASAKTHFSAGQGQILFMRREDVAKMDLSVFGEEVSNGFTYLASPEDPTLNPNSSVLTYSKSLDQDVEFRIDTMRKLSSSHAGGPERPKGVIDALLDQNPNEYRIKTIRRSLSDTALGIITSTA